MIAYNICSGVNFCGENFCGKFFSRQLYFADREKNRKKIAKIRTRKNLVPHGYYNIDSGVNFFFFLGGGGKFMREIFLAGTIFCGT